MGLSQNHHLRRLVSLYQEASQLLVSQFLARRSQSATLWVLTYHSFYISQTLLRWKMGLNGWSWLNQRLLADLLLSGYWNSAHFVQERDLVVNLVLGGGYFRPICEFSFPIRLALGIISFCFNGMTLMLKIMLRRGEGLILRVHRGWCQRTWESGCGQRSHLIVMN